MRSRSPPPRSRSPADGGGRRRSPLSRSRSRSPGGGGGGGPRRSRSRSRGGGGGGGARSRSPEGPVRSKASAAVAARVEEEVGKQVYVGNLAFQTDKEYVEEKFSKFGTITDVYLPADADGRPRGFAFVTFERAADAEDCAAGEG